jgi:hypothetical protein
LRFPSPRDTGSSAPSLFCDAALHLVNTASARGAGGSLDPGEVGEDIDGESRGATPDRGRRPVLEQVRPEAQRRPAFAHPRPDPRGRRGPGRAERVDRQPQAGPEADPHRRRRYSHKRPKPKPLAFTGTASDPLGLTSVQLPLRKTGGGTTTCQWFDGKRLDKVPCAQTILLPATVSTTSWTYTIPSNAKLPKGSYLLYATAVNRAGVAATTFSQAAGNVVDFKVK